MKIFPENFTEKRFENLKSIKFTCEILQDINNNQY